MPKLFKIQMGKFYPIKRNFFFKLSILIIILMICAQLIDEIEYEESIVLTTEHSCITQLLYGVLVSSSGIVDSFLSHTSICLIHSFHPYIKQQAVLRLPTLALKYYNRLAVMSPGIDIHEQKIKMIFRISLNIYNFNRVVKNSYLYTQTFDNTFHPVDSGSLLQLQSTNPSVRFMGQEDPRLIRINDSLLTYYYDFRRNKNNDIYSCMYILDFKTNKSSSIHINGKTIDSYQKNWMAININNNLHFVYSLDPIIILKCSIDGNCFNIIQNDIKNINTNKFVLRGSSPFQKYNNDYKIGLAHSRFVQEGKKWIYASHLIVLHLNPPRIVYLSSPLLLNKTVFHNITRLSYADNFFFPVGIVLESANSIIITGHINDKISIILRLRGLKHLMQLIMKHYEPHKHKSGPPKGFIHEYVHRLLMHIVQSNNPL